MSIVKGTVMGLYEQAAKTIAETGGLPSGDLTSLLSSFASAFTQTTRILKLNFPAGSGIPANLLLPHRLTGSEEVNGQFRYQLDVLSSDVHVELKTVIGQPVEITVLTDAGTECEICGLVMGASQMGSEGGFAAFRLVVESGLSVLRHRVTARVFNQMNVREITAKIISGHLRDNAVLAASFALDDRCAGDYPTRPFAMQYNESDEDYLKRIWAREGISYVIEPAQESSADHPQHVLVLFDDPYDLDPNPAGPVRFHRADGTEQTDAITQWHGHRVLQSGSVSRHAWNHDDASSNHANEDSRSDQGGQAQELASTLNDYRNETHLEGDTPEHHAALTARRMQAREGSTKRFEGAGSVRQFQAGTWFTLTQHPVHDQDDPQDREFVITRLDVEAVNNLPQDLKAGISGLLKRGNSPKPEPPYTNRFTCLRRGIPILAEEIPPPKPGLLTARVVGPEGSVVHTDELGRIKLRFLFTRNEEHDDSGASESDADSAWVRQVEVQSSQGFGGNFIPRVGDEVMVAFLGDDPDKPVCLGCLHNGAKPPASFQGQSALPLDKTLSGIKSEMHHGSGGNELVFDDTTNELRTKFSTDHERTQLHLGHIVHPRSGGVAEPRGEGFELRTDAWGAVRAEKGLLISTDGRPGASGHHADPRELTEQTQASMDLTKALSDASENHQAAKLAVNDQTKDLKTTAEATKAHPNGDAKEDVAAFGKSILGLSSPAGIVEGTPGTIVKSTGKNLQITSGEDTNLAVGRKLVMAIQDAWSVLAAQGIKLFAGKGDIAIQAHEGNVSLTSEKDLKLIACNQGIDLAAKDKLTMASGGAKVELAGGSMDFFGHVHCKAKWNVILPDGKTYDMPTLPKVDELQNRCFVVRNGSGEPVPDTRYEITTDEGKKLTGITDAEGRTCKVTTRNPDGVKIKLL